MLKFEYLDKIYSKEEAKKEADRCLSCKNPMCEKGCPASLPIKEYIKKLKEDSIEESINLIKSASATSVICSVVCNHAKQCVGNCILNKKNNPIQIGHLEEFIISHDYLKENDNKTKGKVAIIGGGPSGISCALFLAKNNIEVTIFEKEDYLGGLLVYGIPEFRLPYKNVQKLIDEVSSYKNIKVEYKKELSYEEIISLKKIFDYVYISIGLNSSKKLRIENEDTLGVYDALDILKESNLKSKLDKGSYPKLKGKTLILGAGNVAMDAARTALRLGSDEVIVVYRRTISEAPASQKEIDDAIEEGVKFMFLTSPSKIILESGKVTALLCEKMILGEPDKSNRPQAVSSGEYITIECDNIIKAIGQQPTTLNSDLVKLDYGYLVTDESNLTSQESVYAGGDITLGASSVVESMAIGRDVAKNILKKLETE